MTIAEEISALRGRIDVAYDHIQAKGGTIPATTDSWNLSTAIDSIPTGPTGPYDAEVAWLESVGGAAYINTGVKKTAVGITTRWEATVGIDNYASANERHFVCGYNSPNNGYYCDMSTTPRFGATLWNTSYYCAYTLAQRTMYKVTGTFHPTGCSYTLTANGTTYSSSATPSQYTDVALPNNPFVLFRITQNYQGRGVMIGANKLYQDDVLKLDLIPVRKDGNGYMYDKLTGTLFGNAGTYRFLIGPDVG